MKLTEIKKMEAGRELDKFIGFYVFDVDWTGCELAQTWPPEYSTGIAAAFEVLEYTGRKYILRKIADHYRATIECQGVGERLVTAAGKTMALSICYALLISILRERGELEE